ncbi:hypothetical protein [Piscirickettsia litoralis]|uniref:Virion structural protein n=1 Tax=Piscirickettsia litoralis TaxID=1891921 RepID=A0ABX3A174_9GAMM|nr:hypothetical protein [Piscirickettsia litoralis]ODN42568.1 hypothetical protein BGC07_06025 [Piscirickettsia litoralis]
MGSVLSAPMKPILAAAAETAIDAILSENRDISEEKLREELRASHSNQKTYPVIRIELAKESGLTFWKFYEKFFAQSVAKIIKKAGLDSNQESILDPRVRFSVSADKQKELDAAKSLATKAGEQLKRLVVEVRYAYTNLYPPEFYSLKSVSKLQLDSISNFMDSKVADNLINSLITLSGYLAQDEKLRKANRLDDFIFLKSQDMMIVAVLCRHFYNILTKPIYICKDNAYSYHDSMYVPSIYFMLDDFSKFLMKVNRMFKAQFDDAISTHLAGIFKSKVKSRKGNKSFGDYVRKFSRSVLGKPADASLSDTAALQKAVKEVTKRGYADVMVQIVTNHIDVDNLDETTVNSLIKSSKTATSFEEAMNVAERINNATGLNGVSAGASGKKTCIWGDN